MYKYSKETYNNSNKHIEEISPQLLRATVEDVWLPTPQTQDVSAVNAAYNLSVSSPDLQSLWLTIITEAVDIVRSMSGLSPPRELLGTVLSLYRNQVKTWKRIKRVKLSCAAPRYPQLKHNVLNGGLGVYGQSTRFDAVMFQKIGVEKVWLIELLVFIRILEDVPPDEGNSSVVSINRHTRLGYSLSQCHAVHSEIVDSENILRPVMVFIDP